MSDVVIELRNLTKLYRIGLKGESSDTLFGSVASFARSPLRNFRKYRSLYRFDDAIGRSLDERKRGDVLWALDDVSFDVRQGDALAIVGGNGAGKSTLLKILSRVTSPTLGYVKMKGNVSSLLEVGTGFHHELTGRENVYLNGAILGMNKREITRKFDQIVEFSGVERFLDTPVKRYSSGMVVRLAFSVAAHLEAEIMILDEVLAVGDAGFQQKCLEKMKEVASSGRTVLFVSHNTTAVESLCKSGIMLQGGKIVAQGTSQEIVKAYVDSLTTVPEQTALEAREDRQGDGEIIATRVQLLDADGVEVDHALTAGTYTFRLHYRCNSDKEFRDCRVAVGICRKGFLIVDLASNLVMTEELRLSGEGYVDFTVPRLPLSDTTYTYYTFIASSSGVKDYVLPAGEFNVVGADFFGTGRLYSHPKEAGRVVLVNFSCSHAKQDEEQQTSRPEVVRSMGVKG